MPPPEVFATIPSFRHRKSNMGKWIIAVCLLLASSLGYARQECAVANGETYLSMPQGGVEVQRGPSLIRKGQRYEVGKVQDGWIAVNADGEFAWANASIFAYSCEPSVGGPGYTAQASEPRKSHAHGTVSKTPKLQQSASSGGNCPCGSGRVCIGPRGGRYCITSGGNKRYGG